MAIGTDGILSTPDGLEECDVYPNTNYTARKDFENDTVPATAPWYMIHQHSRRTRQADTGLTPKILEQSDWVLPGCHTADYPQNSCQPFHRGYVNRKTR